MNTNTGLSVLRVLGPGALVALAAATSPGCSAKDAVGGNCEIQATIDSVGAAATKLNATAASVKASLITACAAIAGETAPAAPTDDDVTTICGHASAAINAALVGGVALSVVPGECHVNASAQLDCEASCQVDASCQGGTIEARCTPGELSVECNGSCEGTLTCEASAGASVACEGTCSAECTGTCSGVCNGTCSGTCSATAADGTTCAGQCDGTCTGSCSATCNGTCSGSCEYTATATATCDSTIRCKGTCTGTASAPECEATLTEPTCQMDADCKSGCEGQANIDAECTPPQIVITGSMDATFAATLQANLPAILQIH